VRPDADRRQHAVAEQSIHRRARYGERARCLLDRHELLDRVRPPPIVVSRRVPHVAERRSLSVRLSYLPKGLAVASERPLKGPRIWHHFFSGRVWFEWTIADPWVYRL